jgi:hypothetical protein
MIAVEVVQLSGVQKDDPRENRLRFVDSPLRPWVALVLRNLDQAMSDLMGIEAVQIQLGRDGRLT